MHKRGTTSGAALAAVGLIVFILCPQALSEVVTVEAPAAVFYAEGDVHIETDSCVVGKIAAGQSVFAGAGSSLQSIYAAGDVQLGRELTVRGRLLAGGSANAGSHLDFEGPSWTGRSVRLGSDAWVVGDVIGASEQITIDRNAQITGNVLGNSDVQIDRDSSIYGDVRPGVGYSLSTASNVTITGSTAPGTVSADSVSVPSLPAAPDAGSYGSQDIEEGSGVTSLAPGAYGAVDLGRGATLNLSAGTYTLKSFWTDREATVNLDVTAGDVIINVHQGFSTGETVSFNTTGEGRLILNVFGGEGVSLGLSNTMAADIRVWDGNFTAGDSLELAGSVWASNITVGAGSNVSYGGLVPEPAAAALIAVGGLLVIQSKRRRNTLRAG
ncbi:MAG: hypothetical protein ACYTF6_09705 [Planctomycetota bacterium]|jgi:hypothetical protein